MEKELIDWRAALSELNKSFSEKLADMKTEYSEGLDAIIWDSAQPDNDAITSLFPELKEDHEILNKFRFLDVYPERKGKKYNSTSKPTIVFRTEDFGTGKAASVIFIHMPGTEFKLKAFKNLPKATPRPDIIKPFTDPIILGDTSELDRFRFSNDTQIDPINEVSICCGLYDGIIIQQNQKTPVWIFKDLQTILDAPLVPIEHLNIWIKTPKGMDYEPICEEVYGTFGDSIPDFNIALYETDPSKPKWWNTMEKAD